MVEACTKVSENSEVNLEEHTLYIFMFASLISADNDELTEETKQELIRRYEEERNKEKIDWDYIMAPMFDDEKYKTRETKEEKQRRKDILESAKSYV